MNHKWIPRRHGLLLVVAIAAAAVFPAIAQHAPSTSSSSAGSSAGSSTGAAAGNTGLTGATNRSTLPSTLNSNSNTNSNYPQNSPTIFLSGTVQFDDGSKPSTDILIERVCSGNPRPEAHVDSKGHFSFQLGQSQLGFSDASTSSLSDWGGRTSGTGSSRLGSDSGGLGSGISLSGCELRASYPGYRSDSISLAGHRMLDNPNVGTIILHRLAAVQGTTISLTTALAPKHAQKEFEKGLQSIGKGKTDDAEKHLLQAVDEYPKFAVAWFQLGQIEQGKGDLESAKKSYKSAIDADSKYLSPYDRLAALALQDGKWQDADDLSKQVISLNPIEFPSAFLYSAVAEYNMKKLDGAEKNAKQVLKIDEHHRYPQAESLLAQVMLDKGNYTEAAQHLRAYLALVPNAKNAEVLKQSLLKIEQASASVKQ